MKKNKIKTYILGSFLAILLVGGAPKLMDIAFQNVASLSGSASSTLETLNNGIVAIAKEVNPSIVTISTEKISKRSNIYQGFGFFDRYIPDEEQTINGLGSGIIIDKKGYILTNNHVIEKVDEIIVRLYDDTELKGKLIGADPLTDIAIIKVETEDIKLPALKIGDSNKLRVGEMVFAIGSPLNKQLAHTVSMGIVSALGRTGLYINAIENYIQTDAAINPGNSGGALVNVKGELIGINTAIASRSGGNQGIGFAIPISMVKDVMKDLIKEGKVSYAYIGISSAPNGWELSESLAKAMELPNENGFVIAEVMNNSPASRAGLKEGDVIVKYNDADVKNWTMFRSLIFKSRPNEEIELKYYREGQAYTTTAILGVRPSDESAENRTPNTEEKEKWAALDAKLGFEIVPNYNTERGLVVKNIDKKSHAYKQGLRNKDRITDIEWKKVSTMSDFYDIVTEKIEEGDNTFLLKIIRDESTRYIAFEIE